LLFVGRFAEKKGIHLLREAVKAHPDWSWLFVGRSDTVDPASWQAANVTVLPPLAQSELADCYASADLMVSPSVGEGFPLTAQESMACGTPALLCAETAAAIPKGRELLFTTEPEPDAVEANLTRALGIAMNNQSLRTTCSRFAREEWSWGNTAHTYLALLGEMLYNQAPAGDHA
jgi:glycosyltransferase involved in cell wall biosynthesis